MKKEMRQFVSDGKSLTIWMVLRIHANKGLFVGTDKSARQISFIGRESDVQSIMFRILFRREQAVSLFDISLAKFLRSFRLTALHPLFLRR